MFRANDGQLPKGYQLSEEVKFIFALIKKIARDYQNKTGDKNYLGYLPQNIFNKIFNKLVIDSINPRFGMLPQEAQAGLKLQRQLQDMLKNTTEIDDFFTSLNIPDLDNDEFSKYKPDDTEGLKVRKNAIEAIRDKIKQDWEVFGFCFFKIGGVNINFEGQSLRVPHRVAAMAQLITNFDKHTDNTNYSADLFKLYDEIQILAQEALNAPRRGQTESTRGFYRAILSDYYLSTDKPVIPLNVEMDYL